MARKKKTEESRLHTLEFERPVAELEEKIEELEAWQREHPDAQVGAEIESLRRRRTELLRKVFQGLRPIDRVRVARHPKRPVLQDYLERVFEEVVELHGDRCFGDDKAIFTGLARLGGRRILLVGHRKGRGMEERKLYNWACAHPEGYRKALAKMKLAEKFGLPVVTLIDTPGAYPGVGAEERGQAAAIARNILEMSRLRTPIVSCVIGEGGSGGALGIGVCDRLLMLEYAYYSVISPEGCAAILWNDSAMAERAADALKLTAEDLAELGVVDEVVPEGLGAAHRERERTAIALRDALCRHLDALEGVSVAELVRRRRERYRWIGDDAQLARAVREAKARGGAPPEEAAGGDAGGEDEAGGSG